MLVRAHPAQRFFETRFIVIAKIAIEQVDDLLHRGALSGPVVEELVLHPPE